LLSRLCWAHKMSWELLPIFYTLKEFVWALCYMLYFLKLWEKLTGEATSLNVSFVTGFVIFVFMEANISGHKFVMLVSKVRKKNIANTPKVLILLHSSFYSSKSSIILISNVMDNYYWTEMTITEMEFYDTLVFVFFLCFILVIFIVQSNSFHYAIFIQVFNVHGSSLPPLPSFISLWLPLVALYSPSITSFCSFVFLGLDCTHERKHGNLSFRVWLTLLNMMICSPIHHFPTWHGCAGASLYADLQSFGSMHRTGITQVFLFLLFYYSYVHTMLGSFLPPAPTPFLTTHSAPSLSPHPLNTQQKLFCPYL
jgi:hypothetical protein